MRAWSTRSRGPYNPRLRTPPDIVEKVLHLRRTYHIGLIRIVWNLERYHGITLSKAGVYRIPCNVLNRMRDLGRPASYAIRR